MTPRTPLAAQNWRAAGHWASVAQRCIDCGGWTHLRNSAREPQHKTCAEGSAPAT